jgi:hypothetical protein
LEIHGMAAGPLTFTTVAVEQGSGRNDVPEPLGRTEAMHYVARCCLIGEQQRKERYAKQGTSRRRSRIVAELKVRHPPPVKSATPTIHAWCEAICNLSFATGFRTPKAHGSRGP